MTADLVAFLTDRLDEDEQIAELADGSRWRANEDRAIVVDDETGETGRVVAVGPWNCSIDVVDSNHIVRHDPARVLADIQAKRAILADIVPALEGMDSRIHSEWGVGDYDPTGSDAEHLLRLMAVVYASHPDFNPDWTP